MRNLILFFYLLITFHSAFATTEPASVPQKAGIIERLETQLDLNSQFEAQDGSIVKLSDYFNRGIPVIIAPVYFECPRLCTLTQNGLLQSVIDSELSLGKEYLVLSVSFNDKETSKQSVKRAEVYRDSIKSKKPELDGNSWFFLTGTKDPVEKLMDQLGFKYEYDQGEYMHAAGIIFITPEGKISRYLYGIEYRPTDFNLSLVEASQGKIGSFMHQAMMFCFRYDYTKGQYTLAIWEIIRIVCSIFALIILAFVIKLKFKENN
jgi:protein SCO1/2